MTLAPLVPSDARTGQLACAAGFSHYAAPVPPEAIDTRKPSVARVTLTGDSRGFERDGTYEIIALAADASGCSFTFDGDEYQAVAYDLSTEIDQVQRLSVTVPAEVIPESDGDTTGVDGRVSFDFNAESIFGMTYTGDASQDEEGSSTTEINRAGETITFTFDSTTWNDATFTGQLVCAAA